MSEWWTYRPSDFLMFSAQAYGRLVELYNTDVWPVHGPVLVAGVVLLWIVAARKPYAGRVGALLLSLGWAWAGWAFLGQRLSQIDTFAPYLAVAFGVQAVLLALLGTRRHVAPPADAWRHALGCTMLAVAVLLYPLLAPVTGRPLAQAELAGLMPQPTALATLGLLLALPLPRWRWLLVAPLLASAWGAMAGWLLLAQR